MKHILFFIFMGLTSSISGQVIIQMKREGGVSTIPCKVNGLMLQFIFDTGASEVSMSMTEASFMLKNGYLSADDIIGTANYLDANGDISEGITIRLREIEIGGLKLKDVRASVVKNLKAPLLLGQSALRKLGKIQFDLEENTITITPAIPRDANNDTTEIVATDIDTLVSESPALEIAEDEMYFKMGMDKYLNEEYRDAIKFFDMAISLNKNKMDYYLQRGLAKDMVNDKRGAVADYDNALLIDPKYSNAYAYRAETKVHLGDTSGALKDLQLAIQFNPKNGYAYRERGKIKFDRNNYSAAILDFTLSLKYEPDNCYTYRLRGLSKYLSDNDKGAKLDFDSAIALCDDVAASWALRGAAKYKLKEKDAALIDLNKAIALDPEIAIAYRYKGLIARDKDELDDAIIYLEKAIELNPSDLVASIMLEIIKDELKERIWIPVGSTNDGDEWFMKNEKESKEYNRIAIWLKVKHKKYTHKRNGKSISYMNAYSLYLVTIDCRTKKLKTDYIVVYDSKGNQLFSEEGDYESWEIVPPGSMGESVVKGVCSRYN